MPPRRGPRVSSADTPTTRGTVCLVRDTHEPSLYDLFHPHGASDNDIEFYLGLARERGGPVLELGAGTGRSLLPLARAGFDCVALDSSARMLAGLREHLGRETEEVRARVSVVPANMQDFRFDQRFGLIQIPQRGFLYNLSDEERRRCANLCLEHLGEDGALAFSAFHPSLEHIDENSGAFEGVWRWRGERADPSNGTIVTLSECTNYDTVAQAIEARFRYERWSAQGMLLDTRLHSVRLAYLYPKQIDTLLRELGFGRVEITGGFAGAPFAGGQRELIVVARR